MQFFFWKFVIILVMLLHWRKNKGLENRFKMRPLKLNATNNKRTGKSRFEKWHIKMNDRNPFTSVLVLIEELLCMLTARKVWIWRESSVLSLNSLPTRAVITQQRENIKQKAWMKSFKISQKRRVSRAAADVNDYFGLRQTTQRLVSGCDCYTDNKEYTIQWF